MPCKMLAIHLPQFHTIPENDEWWGNGFTEWTNVRRGRPYYPGHYQPREPLNDDYYDLSDLKILEKQIRLARKAGIYGFCFYHYYFQGRKLLEIPIEMYRDVSKEHFPYCLIWANQSWSRTWYRADYGKQILLEQSYGKEDAWEEHFYYLLDFFRDKRYIKVGNRPVYIIYMPQDIYCRRSMFALWNRLAREQGFDGIYLIAMKTVYGYDSASKLYDAYMEFEPLASFYADKSWRAYVEGWKNQNINFIKSNSCCFKNRLFMNNQFSYSYLGRKIIQKAEKSDSKTFAGIFPGWDNTPRKDEEGVIVTRSTPGRFGKLARRVMDISEQCGKEFVFVNAWNEWSEGAYLEPDKRYGYQYLNALKRAAVGSRKNRVKHRAAANQKKIKRAKTKLKQADIYKENSDKHFALFMLMNQWLKVKQAGVSLEDYFVEKGYKSIAVYGMSYVGERLIAELKNSSVKIAYGIDKKEKGSMAGIEIINNFDRLPEVDAVVVTSVFYMNEIEEDLSRKVSCPVLSLEEILYYVMS